MEENNSVTGKEKLDEYYREALLKARDKRKWDNKDWQRAIGYEQSLLEDIEKGVTSLNESQFNQMLELTKKNKLPKLLRFETPCIIGNYSYKGGTGKTTIASNLAFELSRRGYRVLGIDTDGQRNFTGTLFYEYISKGLESVGKNFYNCFTKKEPIEKHVWKTSYDNLDIIAGSVQNEQLDSMLHSVSANEKNEIIEACFDKLIENNYYDFVIMDMDKGAGPFNKMLMSIMDYIISIGECGIYSIESIPMTTSIIQSLKDVNPTLKLLGFLFNRVDFRRSYTNKEPIDLANAALPGLVFKTYIKSDTIFERAQAQRVPVFLFQKKCSPAKQIMELTDEILDRIQKNMKE